MSGAHEGRFVRNDFAIVGEPPAGLVVGEVADLTSVESCEVGQDSVDGFQLRRCEHRSISSA